MYAWKCWRETRARFFVLLVVLVSFALLILNAVLTRRTGARIKPDDAQFFAVHGIIGISGVLSMLSGLFLGVTSPGQEFENGTVEYLWTRPRSRAHFNLVHWGINASELAVLAATPLLVTAICVALVNESSTSWPRLYWPLLLSIPVCLLCALSTFALATLMTSVRRSTSGGLIFSVGIVAGYELLAGIMLKFWGVHLPGLADSVLNWPMDAGTQDPSPFPWAATLRLACAAIIFPVMAHFILKRAEV